MITFMSIELRHLRYLLAVAEHGNFTRAAEELHLSQPTLSQQIKQLEKFAGAALFDRGGRTVQLTDTGRVYADGARRVLRELATTEHAAHDVMDLSRGHLRLAVTPTFTTYLVGPMLSEMHARYPGISLELTETTQDRIESRLLADEFDLGIAFAPSHLPGVETTALYTETLGLVVRADGTGVGRRIPVQDLAERDIALLTVDFATRSHIDEYLHRHRVHPRTVVQANSIHAVIEIVQRTALATVLPDAITDDHPRLSKIGLDPPLTRTVVLMRRGNAYHSAASPAFPSLAVDWVRSRAYPAPATQAS